MVIRLVENIGPCKVAVMQWKTQAVKITTDFKVNVEFTLPALSATNVVMWKCHVDDSARDMHDMVLGRDIFNIIRIKSKKPYTLSKQTTDLL